MSRGLGDVYKRQSGRRAVVREFFFVFVAVFVFFSLLLPVSLDHFV